jgi:endoglucanase
MLAMQDDDGGVWHKQTSEQFCGFVMPEKDRLVSYVIGTGSEPFKSSCATGDFAAVMAIAGRVYKPFDAEFAARCLRAAEKAWDWLGKHPNVTFRNPAGVGTGGYGDGNCGDERLWAAAELARTTRGDAYQRYFLEHYALESTEFPPISRPSIPSSAWSAVSARYSGRSTGQPGV